MASADDEERELKANLMQTQIELYKARLRWEPWKALAATVAAAAVFAGSVLAVSNWIASRPQSALAPAVSVYQVPPGTTITTPKP